MEVPLKRRNAGTTRAWWVALFVGLALLAVAIIYLGRSTGSIPETDAPVGEEVDVARTSTVSDPASFLQDYDAERHDQAILGTDRPTSGSILDLLAKFGFILILLYASLHGLKMLSARQQGFVEGASDRLSIVETHHLSSNRTLYLVSSGSKLLLVGGTDQQLTMLADLTDEDFIVEDWAMEDDNLDDIPANSSHAENAGQPDGQDYEMRDKEAAKVH